MKPKDCMNHAETLAGVLQEFIWIHSGSDNGIGLQKTFEDALKALKEYREALKPVEVGPLKEILEEAYFEAFSEINRDPWAAVLEALADRAQDWEKCVSDDGSVTDDIKTWLKTEAEA